MKPFFKFSGGKRRELKVVSGGGADNVSVLQTKNYLDTYENDITDINTSKILNNKVSQMKSENDFHN